ncbi:MAG: hypothetical protein ABJB74_15390 [Gemmatimonas sp.]
MRAARQLVGVDRIALLGSVLTEKARPKDVDVLVSVNDGIDFAVLARLGRRLQGTAQARINSGADIFLADARGAYLGRVCHYRACHPRARCHAHNCGIRPHVADDFDVVQLKPELIVAPPLQVFPTIFAQDAIPADVEFLLLRPLKQQHAVAGPTHGAAAVAVIPFAESE